MNNNEQTEQIENIEDIENNEEIISKDDIIKFRACIIAFLFSSIILCWGLCFFLTAFGHNT